MTSTYSGSDVPEQPGVDRHTIITNITPTTHFIGVMFPLVRINNSPAYVVRGLRIHEFRGSDGKVRDVIDGLWYQ